MSDCLFCKIAAGEIPSDCLYNADGIFAFRDIQPQAPVHFLVIPSEHIASGASEITAENSALVGRCLEVAARLAEKEGIADGGYRIVTNCGANAGQTVPHLHFHVLGGEKLNGKMC